jgi:hypothetical protein
MVKHLYGISGKEEHEALETIKKEEALKDYVMESVNEVYEEMKSRQDDSE